MIAGYKDGSVRVWNTKNGKIVQERVGIHSFPVCDVATLVSHMRLLVFVKCGESPCIR